MRLAIVSFVFLSALMFTAASIAGHPGQAVEESRQEGVEAAGKTPPVQAAPPGRTPISAPVFFVPPAVDDRDPGFGEDESEPRDD